jgi:hypothetical protein
MTVQELYDILERVDDKTLEVIILDTVDYYDIEYVQNNFNSFGEYPDLPYCCTLIAKDLTEL